MKNVIIISCIVEYAGIVLFGFSLKNGYIAYAAIFATMVVSVIFFMIYKNVLNNDYGKQYDIFMTRSLEIKTEYTKKEMVLKHIPSFTIVILIFVYLKGYIFTWKLLLLVIPFLVAAIFSLLKYRIDWLQRYGGKD